ncbi:MAG TPA: DUF4168 domain-containing protein [Reyranella sp.]|nr:DUF4168 domain-containing protein [Reyranella sp.]
MSNVRLFAVTVLAFGLGALPAAYANTPGAGEPSVIADADQSVVISESKLDAVAAAVKQVAMLKETYEAKLAKAPEDQKVSVVEEANEAAEKAIKEQGLSVEEFVTIMDAADSDPAVRAKIIRRLK